MSYDKLFKTFMGHLKVARSMVQQFIPQDIQKHLDLDTLRVCSGNFIDPAMRETHADMLYRVDLTGDGQETPGQAAQKKVYVHLLWEHQSTYQKHMAFRMLRYCFDVMLQEVKQNADKLPLVIPVLVYNGSQSPYPGSTDILDSFENRELAKEFFHFPFILLDLTVMEDDDLLGNTWTGCLNMLLKHMRDENFLNIMPKLFKPMLTLRKIGGSALVDIALQSIVGCTNILDRQALIKVTSEVSQELGEDMRTAAQGWFDDGYNKGVDKGMHKGLRKGITQGVTKGVTQGRREVIMKFVEGGMGMDTIAECIGMSVAEIEDLLGVASSVDG